MEAGERLGDFEILSRLGEGGMGQVFRARDTRLGRDVAIKILPEEFAHDDARLARFEQEAKLLAALNHPNVATIFGVDREGERYYLVLELVPGADLADRIAGSLAREDALEYAIQIAAGLSAAHERGIVHRDLKPENVRVTPDGHVKVLDFGLAKAPEAVPGEALVVTREGTMIGSAFYMSPEQVRTRPVDRRADLWAYGCLVYEMLAGKRAFDGRTGADVVAAILEREPDWTALPDDLPPQVVRLLRRCLAKDPEQRMRDVADARLELEEVRATGSPGSPGSIDPMRQGPATRPRSPVGFLVVAIAAAAAGFLLGRAVDDAPRPTSVPEALTRLTLELPAGHELVSDTWGGSVALAPDGRRVAYVARDEYGVGPRRVWLRDFSSSVARPVVRTEGAHQVSFAPDGTSFLFTASAGDAPERVDLRRGTFDGSPPVTLVRGLHPKATADWDQEGGRDEILLARGPREALSLVPPEGGEPREVFTLPVAVGSMQAPQRLPNGAEGEGRVLVSVILVAAGGPRASAQVIDFATGEARLLLEDAAFSRWVRSPGGDDFLLFTRDDLLMASRFDPLQARVRGAAVALVGGVSTEWSTGRYFCVSEGGTVLFPAKDDAVHRRRLVWVDDAGAKRLLCDEDRAYDGGLALSPDGGLVAAVSLGEARLSSLWIYEIAAARWRSLDGVARFPIWHPDGERVIYTTIDEDSRTSILMRRADGTDAPLELHRDEAPNAVTVALAVEPRAEPGAERLAVVHYDVASDRSELTLRSMQGEESAPLARAQGLDCDARFSPDGRWLAYSSVRDGRSQIEVVDLTAPERRWPVTTQGGRFPRWSRDGSRLSYLVEPDRLAVVDVSTEEGFVTSRPRELFAPLGEGLVTGDFGYDVGPRGFLFVQQPARGAARFGVLLDLFAELDRIPAVD